MRDEDDNAKNGVDGAYNYINDAGSSTYTSKDSYNFFPNFSFTV